MNRPKKVEDHSRPPDKLIYSDGVSSTENSLGKARIFSEPSEIEVLKKLNKKLQKVKTNSIQI